MTGIPSSYRGRQPSYSHGKHPPADTPIRLIRNPDFANEHVRTNFAVWLRCLRPAGLSDTVIIERLQRLMVLWLEGYQAPDAAATLKGEGL